MAAARSAGSPRSPASSGASARSAGRTPITAWPSSAPKGRALPPGEIGEVELGGLRDNVYRYARRRRLRIRVDSRGRMKTGDLGFLDGDGYLHLTGRAKDLIIRGGVNISPLEIDGVLMQRPDVIEACTVGVPDKVYGEEVVAYVVLRPGAASAPTTSCATARRRCRRSRRRSRSF